MTNNQVILTGNLGAQAREHQTEDSVFSTFSMATQKGYYKDGEWHDRKPEWHNNMIAFKDDVRKKLKLVETDMRVTVKGHLWYKDVKATLENGQKRTLQEAFITVTSIEQSPLFKMDQLSEPANDNTEVGKAKEAHDQPQQKKA
ncbi:MAG: single-stranded DNA-binding protein [Bacteroidia bacterium]|nr:single-stranded DNA-binding protein [Bacteroidia bacterium]